MKAIKFNLRGKFAHFKIPEVNSYAYFILLWMLQRDIFSKKLGDVTLSLKDELDKFKI